MEITTPKFHEGQYVFYDGEVRMIIELCGYLPEKENRKAGWYYTISDPQITHQMVKESDLTGDVDDEYKRMQKRVGMMTERLDKMLDDYGDYLKRMERLIKSKED